MFCERKIFSLTMHTAENEPSGLKSEDLNFFFGIYLYAVYTEL